ncbi:hypothetical protein [Saccharopolyspora spinosa]|uniref:hypothetical protein n=1 Tax=Saccharopolyspora spinosa TaxID=60894 RepID=UPI000237A86B|nr:hypothetical protein [Saccharopolyspora spinosa]
MQQALHVVDLFAVVPGETPEVVEASELKAELCELRAKRASSYVSRSLYRI